MDYLLVGSGRLATHLNHYMKALGLPTKRWARAFSDEAQLNSLSHGATHTLLAVSDSAIDLLIERHPHLQSTTLVHFSGSHQSPLAEAVHPLMSFPTGLFSFEQYQRIPFILTQDAPDISQLLPGFPNPSFRIDREKKALYHSYCVLGGNFSVFLWQQYFQGMTSELKLPEEALIPYLEQITVNLKADWSVALTGPLVRSDLTTINNNISALGNSPLSELYKSFVKTYEALAIAKRSLP